MEGEIVLLNCKFPLYFSFLTFQRTSPGFFFRKCVPLLIYGKKGINLVLMLTFAQSLLIARWAAVPHRRLFKR